MASAREVTALLEKTSDYDKDERYMAVNDLCRGLEGEVKMDIHLERRICQKILERLDDSSNDVQTVAVRCLNILVKKVEETQVRDICNKLANLILSGKADLRDIYAIGLKTCLGTLPASMGPKIAMDLASRLLGGVKMDQDESIKLECLDLLTDLIKFYGGSMTSEHSHISTTALQQLSFPKPAVRKRAAACLGRLATVVSDDLLDRIIQTLLEQIENPKPGSDKRTLIQTIGTISRMVGFRLGSHLQRIVPLFLASLKKPGDESMQTEESDELRENILHAFESFVIRCPHEAASHIPEILEPTLAFLRYDPNYNYNDEDDDGEDMEAMDDYDDEEYEDYDDDEYSDEDDTSWKVRRASVKVVRAVIISRPDSLDEIYAKCGGLLLNCFKERDDNVRLDLVSCYSVLLRTLRGGSSLTLGSKTSNSAAAQESARSNSQARARIAEDVPKIVKVTCKILKEKKAEKTRTSTFELLQELVLLLSGGLEKHVPTLVPLLVDSMRLDRDSSLIFACLQFIGKLFETHPATCIQPHLEKLSPPILACAGAEWYKIAAEALRVIAVMVAVFRPRAKGTGDDVDMADAAASDFECAPFVRPCFEAILPRLQTHHIDQEIKECAIFAMGALFSRCGDMLTGDLSGVLELLQERLRNEITRLPALKCIEEIASSPLRLDLSAAVASLVGDLVNFLRQQSRTLKQNTLSTLRELIKSSPSSLEPALYKEALENAAKLIDDRDLYLSQMAVSLCITALEQAPDKQDIVAITAGSVLPRCIQLMTSSLLQTGGTTLDSILQLLALLMRLQIAPLTFDEVLAMVVRPSQDSSIKLSKSAVSSLSRGIGTICTSCPDTSQRDATVNKIIEDVKGGAAGGDDLAMTKMNLALLSLGEVGRDVDLASISGEAYSTVLACLDKKSCPEEVKSASATALGNLTLGNMPSYLPLLMTALHERKEEAQQYLLLSSLREVIVRHNSSKAAATSALPVDDIVPVLERHCRSTEEGVRNMVAECFGKLAILKPSQIVPYLAQAVQKSAEEPMARCTLVMALKFASNSDQPVDALRENIGTFVDLLDDKDLHVRRAAIVAFTSLAHHRTAVIHGVARDRIVPALFKDMSVDPSLKRTVDLGPFKHVVDDGLPLRKASFSCILTMLDTIPETVSVVDLLPHLAKGLGDVDEVQMLCHQILVQIAQRSPHVLLSEVGTILEPLAQTLNKTVKESQGSVVNHANNEIRSALRALDAIAAVPESHQDRRITDLVAAVLAKDATREMIVADHLGMATQVAAK
ncbi:Cullin-associated NEDD8-dissociated protein 1 [Hondaea fermentalgiana]|uniref:Cullin-associated NEDD8-dissociated protein 1 n=1 Tax=Hondaea fermentalgiana TaxID=2315210 RepID=A0A2R5G6T4_9STRA|nr:Cullin-associated NEDD8-dissociated protein 1 [Hondaea fermentalgiana]|eukprot:GBG26235.1 Cullin-associated NEDD8-dissociated protein 1 [Hondaea fermentalgiana]